MGLSVTTLVLSRQAHEGSHLPASGVPTAVSRQAEVTTAELVYEPGHSSGWHVHPGLHAVVVLSGTLTVYDEACRPQDYGPGQVYLGGREPHLARNRGTEAVALVVTYVPDVTAQIPGSPVVAPSGCEAA
jgi:quercetin dioxygenase-like cupin family protein